LVVAVVPDGVGVTSGSSPSVVVVAPAVVCGGVVVSSADVSAGVSAGGAGV
jgi:hypothetical protein